MLIPGSNTSPILSSLDILFDQSVSDFPCHVTIMSSAKFHDEEIKQKDYIENVRSFDDSLIKCSIDKIGEIVLVNDNLIIHYINEPQRI